MEDAFLRAIEESPDDDAPRLIYADWLEEHSDPRGASIRAQCELSASEPHSARWHDWRIQSELLLGQHREALAERCEALDLPQETLRLHRGFPVRVPVLTDQLYQLDRLAAQIPLCSVILRPHEATPAGQSTTKSESARLSRVSDLVVYSLTGELPDVFDWPLSSVQSLTLAGGMTSPDLPSRFSDTGLSQNLKSLWLRGKGRPTAHAQLVEFPNLKNLRLSSVTHGRSMLVAAPQLEALSVADDAEAQLASLPLEQLTSLSVHSRNRDTLETLARSGAFHGLQNLNLAGVDLAAIQRQFTADWAESLEYLAIWTQPELRQNILSCRLLESLPEGRLRHARGRNWGPHELSVLLQGGHPLRSLTLTRSDFDPGPIDLPFAAGPLTKTLQRLEFKNSRLSAELVDAMSECCFEETTTLSLSGCQLAGVNQLLAADVFPNLRVLDLYHLDLRGGRLASTLKTLLKGHYPHLLELNLDETPVTPKWAREVLQSPRFPKLKRLVHRQFQDKDRLELAQEFTAKLDAEPLDAVIIERPSADYANI